MPTFILYVVIFIFQPIKFLSYFNDSIVISLEPHLNFKN